MSSLVPPGNQFWHCPNISRYAEGLNREERTKMAYEILLKAGYKWRVPPINKEGKVIIGKKSDYPTVNLWNNLPF